LFFFPYTGVVNDGNLLDLAKLAKHALETSLGRVEAQTKHTKDGRWWRRLLDTSFSFLPPSGNRLIVQEARCRDDAAASVSVNGIGAGCGLSEKKKLFF